MNVVKNLKKAKGLTQDFGQKLENSSEVVSFSKRPRYDVWWCFR